MNTQYHPQPLPFPPPKEAKAKKRREKQTPEGAKVKAIKRASRNSSAFVDEAFLVLKEVAAIKPFFSSIDVWAAYEMVALRPRPKGPRAMGGVFTRAKDEGVIRATDRRVKSGRVSDHNQWLTVWESLTFGGSR